MKRKPYLITNNNLMAEWDWQKNQDLSPNKLTLSSGKKAWWLCPNGHSYESQISNRSNGQGCPYCSGRVAISGENDLQTLYPNIAKQWNYQRNHPLTPDRIKPQSNKKVWWVCEKGHEYEASVCHRFRGDGCPYCSHHKVLPGFNDLSTLSPKLAKEWHPYKNDTLKPNMVTPRSGTAVWWLCSVCGHEWQTALSARCGCPSCSSKRMTSFPEQALFFYISKLFPDAINRYPYHSYELDIFIPSISTAIEYDGSYYHNLVKSKNKDNIKDDLCKKDGIRLIRFRDAKLAITKNAEIINCTDFRASNFEDFENALNELLFILGKENSIEISIKKDWMLIESNFKYYFKEKGLSELYPEIAAQWHSEKNGGLVPNNFSYGSSNLVWWKCSKGHEWEASINSRTNMGSGCPICSGHKIIPGINDLQTLRPDIAKDWNYKRNANITPDKVSVSSNKRVWWKCSRCGHEWQSSIAGHKHPYCAKCSYSINGEKISVSAASKNNLAQKRPDLLKQWHPIKNGNLKPTDVSCGSGKQIWWICDKGHEWQSSISNRVKDNLGCPYCGNQKVLIGFNDFPTFYPKLATEWNYEKNNGLSPHNFVSGSGKSAWWKCKNCSYEWKSPIRVRTRGSKCPNCKTCLSLSKNDPLKD